jgi:hypothetical protein
MGPTDWETIGSCRGVVPVRKGNGRVVGKRETGKDRNDMIERETKERKERRKRDLVEECDEYREDARNGERKVP